MKTKHGGKRKGSGRPKGPKERKSVSSSISMPLETWAKLDRLRKEATRSKYIATILENEKEKD